MPTNKVGIWITEQVYNRGVDNYGDGYRARDRVIQWLQNSASINSNIDFDLVYGDKTPSPPDERPGATQEGKTPCTTSFEETWNSLRGWWKDEYKADCKDYKQVDIAVLISDSDGGGRGNGKFAAVGTGQEVVHLSSSPEDFGGLERHKGYKAILHEIGHCLLRKKDGDGNKRWTDGDGDGKGGEHDMAMVQYDVDNDKYGITPMGIVGGNDQNNCNSNEVSKSKTDYDDDNKPDHFALYYSDCTNENVRDVPPI
jgi:hypothetical protein